jgi:hypothetical protein
MTSEDTWTVSRKDGKSLTFTHRREGDEDIVTAEVEGEPRQHLIKRAASFVSLSREEVQELFGTILEEGPSSPGKPSPIVSTA